jgi:hypothetical protein
MRIIKVAPCLALLLLASPVLSQDQLFRRHAAGACTPFNNTDKTWIGYDVWGVYNRSTSRDSRVYCGGQFAWPGPLAKIGVYDNHETRGVSCTMTLIQESGSLASWSQTVGSSGRSDAMVWLNFTPPLGPDGTRLRGTFASNCLLPRVGAVGMSRVSQFAW